VSSETLGPLSKRAVIRWAVSALPRAISNAASARSGCRPGRIRIASQRSCSWSRGITPASTKELFPAPEQADHLELVHGRTRLQHGSVVGRRITEIVRWIGEVRRHGKDCTREPRPPWAATLG